MCVEVQCARRHGRQELLNATINWGRREADNKWLKNKLGLLIWSICTKVGIVIVDWWSNPWRRPSAQQITCARRGMWPNVKMVGIKSLTRDFKHWHYGVHPLTRTKNEFDRAFEIPDMPEVWSTWHSSCFGNVRKRICLRVCMWSCILLKIKRGRCWVRSPH